MHENLSRKSVCLISGGLQTRNMRLQPWRYLFEVIHGLRRQGHEVTVITEDEESETAVSHPYFRRIPTISNRHWRENQQLLQTIAEIQPELILWHIGLTSFLHQQFDPGLDVPVVGVFTSPLYETSNLTHVNPCRTINSRQINCIHTMGTLLPNRLLHQMTSRSKHLQQIVVQTKTTGHQLQQSYLSKLPISVIPPGVDAVWENGRFPYTQQLRQILGYDETDVVVLYFGSPAPLRGLHTLIEAVKLAKTAVPTIKLLILSRRHADELVEEDAELRNLLADPDIRERSQIISGYLEPENLVNHISVSDIVALPFELVPSDAPLSLLEAKALGKPVVTTQIACLPELVADGPHYLAQPSDAASLAHALSQAAHDLPSINYITAPSVRRWSQVGVEWSQLIQAV